ncbi:aminoglycoside phosphotransferase family protein [Yinghuangia sp. YIM S09857]|uniref:aminoglycoside phosphotransferase family protein n=1 Tax=Yinghuangia sp. YIM S09857 TaxID=3436929 RepID=UPI003F52A1E9
MRANWKPDRAFRRFVSSAHGAAGRAWLAELPGLVEAYAAERDLAVGDPYPLSYNFVVPVDGPQGAAVLKIAPPGTDHLAREAAVLRVWDGEGAVRVHDFTPELNALLMERAEPGVPLADHVAGSETAFDFGGASGTAAADDEATSVLAATMRALWRPVPAELDVPDIADHAQDFAWYRAKFGADGGPIPGALPARAAELFDALVATSETRVLLHADLHHDNVLRAERDGDPVWLAIDPHGAMGDPGFDTAQLLWNPGDLLAGSLGCTAARVLDARLDRLAADLDGTVPGADLGRERLTAWAFAKAVLSAVWMIQDFGHPGDSALAVARLLDPGKDDPV